MALRVGQISPATVFDLMGRDENSATFAIGWSLERCACFKRALVENLSGVSIHEDEDFTIDLQRHAEDGGYTDIEIRIPNRCHIIVEAKKGWLLPQRRQLDRYVGRLRGATSEVRRIVSISAASEEFARRNQSGEMGGIVCAHRSWRDIRRIAQLAQRDVGRFEERLWLRELISHLREYEYMSRVTDNQVFVVSLSAGPVVDGESDTWIDVVARDNRYFHPIGDRWPVEPPNYIGFRYNGRLQSVHHVDGHEVIVDVSTINKNRPQTERAHFVYVLGPAMRPSKEIKSGPIWDRRDWCAIDTLLSGAYSTISDARNETKRREAERD